MSGNLAEDDEPMENRMNILNQLAKQFRDRATAQGLRGKAADKAAIEFFLGAAAALGMVGKTDDMNQVINWTSLVLCTRGFREVERMAA